MSSFNEIVIFRSKNSFHTLQLINSTRFHSREFQTQDIKSMKVKKKVLKRSQWRYEQM